MKYDPNRRQNHLRRLAKSSGISERVFDDLLRSLPIQDGKVLGCGQMGCAFLGTHGVVKITTDKTEVDLWKLVVELRSKGLRLAGMPEVYSIESAPGGKGELFVVQREDVEPLVLGKEWKLGPRTRRWIFGAAEASLPEITLSQESFSLEDSLDDQDVPRSEKVQERARAFDEEVQMLYRATDVVEFAEFQKPARKAWKKAYVDVLRSCQPPFRLIGESMAEILEHTGETWITDVHPGNVGWKSDTELVVYDFMSFRMHVNGAWTALHPVG